jgi:cytochrome c-type biogenesis protein CcmE
VAPKRQRLILAVLALVAILGAGLLATYALRQQAAYFYTPSEARAAEARNDIRVGAELRLGGMVQRGSIIRQPDGVTIAFLLADTTATVPVRFTGITPDLFAEGSGAVADGHFDASGTFVARNILAKHDERYVPPQMGQMPSDPQAGLEKGGT